MLRSAFLLTILFFFGCKSEENKNEAAFYYWKTTFNLNTTELATLAETGSENLYIRFFDVDKINDSLIPLGIINGLEKVPAGQQIIPVVFITNRSFLNAQDKQLIILADRVVHKINALLKKAGKECKEIQIDCDWSEKTRQAYFYFLEQIKKRTQRNLSVTIRLHQVKYPARTGIPPADRGMLMFYNMGTLKPGVTSNSIFNRQDADKYVDYIGFYALPLDVALPVFSWKLHYSDGKLIGILNKEEMPDSTVSQYIKPISELKSEIISPFLHKRHYYKKGDVLREEKLSDEDLKLAAEMLSARLDKKVKRKIAFFDLDEYNLKAHTNEEIKNIMDSFN